MAGSHPAAATPSMRMPMPMRALLRRTSFQDPEGLRRKCGKGVLPGGLGPYDRYT